MMTPIRPAARKIVSALGALVLALGTMTASAQPVRAGNDVAKVLAGVAAIAIIGTALSDKGRAEARPVHGKPQPGWHQPVPPRPQAHVRPRPGQACVQTGPRGQVVCGQAVNNRPPVRNDNRHGWHNDRDRRGDYRRY